MHPRFANVETVTLYVGKDNLKFQVHEDELFDASPLFRKAFTSKPEEDSEQVLDFSGDDPGLFGHLIQCIYSKSFSMDIFEDAKSDSEREVQAAQLFVLAEKYGVEAVMLSIGIKLHAYGNDKKHVVNYAYEPIPPERRAVEIAYQYTHRDSILRRVFADWYSSCTMSEDASLRDWLPTVPEYASDLLVTKSRKQEYFKRTEQEYLRRLMGKAYKAL